MLRKFVILLMSVTLCWTTLACSSPQTTSSQSRNPGNAPASARLSDGKYPVQQATYNDVDGQYSLMVLNTPPGSPPVFSTTNLQMARLTEEEVAAGEKTYLKIDDNQPVMYLTEDFKIEYVHNVAETQTNPQTGQQETVIVRQQSSFWAPFAGALAGQALGSLLFRPQYYVPPVYQPGGILTGYGGYGNTYNQAVDRYQTRYQAPPPAVSNRQALRTTGGLRNSSRRSTTGRNSANSSKSTGSGFGSSNLRQSNKSGSSRSRRSNSSFGSSGTRRRSFSGGGRRRR